MKYHNITKADMKNGDGLRVVLWVSGCDHKCPKCQNPVTWDPNDGVEFDDDALYEIILELRHDYTSGLTLSGGDPLYPDNRETIHDLCKNVKRIFNSKKNIWLYTGYLYEEIADIPILDYVDVVVDGKYINELKDNNAMWRGSTNQRVIDVKKTREAGKIVLHCE